MDFAPQPVSDREDLERHVYRECLSPAAGLYCRSERSLHGTGVAVAPRVGESSSKSRFRSQVFRGLDRPFHELRQTFPTVAAWCCGHRQELLLKREKDSSLKD